MCKTEYDMIIEAQERLPHFPNDRSTRATPLVYQYRNFDSFWKIIKSDSFWATNARFSNDEAEQQFGMEVISSVSNRTAELYTPETLGLDENYIICFCGEDDKLSQWRGYAPKGGVSLGLRFGMPQIFSACCTGTNPTTYVSEYAGLATVKYIPSREDGQSDDEYQNECRTMLALIDSAAPAYNEEVFRREIQKKAPYIKHNGFMEEEEYRIVFRNQDGRFDSCLNYLDSEDASMRYPYIEVKSFQPGIKNVYAVRVCVQRGKSGDLAKKLQEALVGHCISVHACDLLHNDVNIGMDELFCRGCILRCSKTRKSTKRCCSPAVPSGGEYDYCLHNDTNCVVVSQGNNQREVYEIVRGVVQEFCGTGPKIPVWCEGHLPLQKITVGPCSNQRSMMEAIRHYCKHTYWLRDVEIKASKIPFRKSL